MEKEAAAKAGLEKKLNSITNLCGRRIRTFDTISDLEGIEEIRESVPYAKESGTMRADVMDSFRISINSLIKACEACFSSPVADFEAVKQKLVETHDEEDPFLKLLNDRQFDGIYELAADPARKKQYRQIKESYFDDRAAVVDAVHRRASGQKSSPMQRRLWPLYALVAANTVLLAALAAGFIYGALQFRKFGENAQSIEQGLDIKERHYICQFYEFADKIDPPKDDKDRESKRNAVLAERINQVLQVYEQRLISQGEARYREISAEEYKQWGDDLIKRINSGEIDFDKVVEGYFKRRLAGEKK